nr:glutathione S-transferase [Piscinibacter gummiphilus]
MPSTPILYSFRRCPYAMRARLALLQAARPFQPVEVSLRDKPAALLRLSPKGTVPVMQLPDGRVLEESWDIMRWAWADGDGEGWWSRAQSAENLALLHRNDGDFKHWLDRFKYPERFEGDGVARRDIARSRAVVALLVPLEGRLSAAPWLGGSAPCATDLAVFPFVRQFAAVDRAGFDMLPLPALHAWLGAWLGSDLFAACMVKPLPPVSG